MDEGLTTIKSSIELLAEQAGYISARHVSVFRCTLPAKTQSQALRLAPVALEEHFADDIEDLHFAAAKDGAEWVIWVCSTALMHQVVDSGSVSRILPDYFALPHNPDKPTYYEDEEYAVVRLDAWQGFAIGSQNLDSALHLAGFERSDCQQIGEDALLKKPVLPAGKLNLLQGEFSTQLSVGQWLVPWGGSAAALVLLGLFVTAQIYVDNQRLEKTISAQKVQNTKLFRKTFPAEKRIVNIRSQATQKFRKLKAVSELQSTSLTALLLEILPLISKQDGIEIEAIQYANYTMQLQMRLSSVAQAEKLTQALQSVNGLQVQSQGLSQEGETVRTSVSISKKLAS